VTVTDANGCTETATTTITEPTAINLSTSVTDETSGNDGAVNLTVTGGTPGYSYSWSNGATTEDISNIAGGTYTVTVTDDNGCTASVTVTVPSHMGADPSELNGTIAVYPNPSADGNMVVRMDGIASGEWQLEVIDLSGKKLFRQQFTTAAGSYVHSLNLSSLPAGTFVLHIWGGQSGFIRRVVITRP
jgi:hypothetical protein